MKKVLIPILLLILLINCVSKQRENELLEKIANLERQLDECENGAEKLHAKMEISFKNEDFISCKSIFNEMKKRHPESEYYYKVKAMFESVEKIEEKRERTKKIKEEQQRQTKLKALKKLKKTFDDVSGITWYKQPYFVHYNNTNLVSIYIGQKEGSVWLRLRMSYQGDDWIFFENAYLSYSGNTKEIIFDKYNDKETDNRGGVWEWIDVSVSKEMETFLRDFAKSKNTKMRLSGKYTKTRTLTWNERQGIIDVLNGYDALKQNL